MKSSATPLLLRHLPVLPLRSLHLLVFPPPMLPLPVLSLPRSHLLLLTLCLQFPYLQQYSLTSPSLHIKVFLYLPG